MKKGRVPAGRSCLVRQGNPEFDAGDGVFARKTQNTISGMCGILVFWCSGLALVRMRFLFWRAAFLSEKPRIPSLGLISRTSIAAGGFRGRRDGPLVLGPYSNWAHGKPDEPFSFCFIHPPAVATLGASVCTFMFMVGVD